VSPATTAAHTGDFEVKIGGQPLSQERAGRLVRMEVDQAVGVADMFRLTFNDDEFEVIDASSIEIGREVVITAKTDAGNATLITGEITAIEVDYQATGGMLTVVRGFDRSHRLDRGRKTRTFLNTRYSDIAAKIASEVGLSPTVESTPQQHEHVAQANLSDGEFLRALAREIGYEVLVEGRKLVFRKPKRPGSPVALTWKENLVEVQAVLRSAESVADVQVRGWDPKTKEKVVGSAAPTAVGLAPGLGKSPKEIGTTAFGSAELRSVSTGYGSQSEADTAAKAIAEEIGSAYLEVNGVAEGQPTLLAGGTVEIKGLGTRLSGKYVLTTVRHTFDPQDGAYRTAFTVSGRHDRSLYGLVSEGDGRRQSPALGPSVTGVVTALVTNNKDPDGYGRVKVKFPWLDDNLESHWVRLMQPIAGKDFGMHLLPEINSEVLVAFDHGDFNRGYVIGGLYNKKDKPKRGNDALLSSGGDVIMRTIESRTNHRIELCDKPGPREGVTLKTGDDKFMVDLDQKNTKIVVNSDGTVEITAKKGITVTTQDSLKLKATNNVEIEGMKVSIKGTQGVVVDGATVDVKGSAKAAVQAPQLELKGTANTDVGGGAMCNIKGGLVKIN
jgi:uncharacterized protein involved in type VI secretion and phage assembly